jgi:ATP-dependent RNA helicase RhlE
MCWALPKPARGKTAAFALPLIEKLADAGRARPRCPRALILAPTRELAAQIQTEIRRFTAGNKTRSFCVFGGAAIRPQAQALARGTEILVATPGRLIDLMSQRMVSLGEVRHLVLDEADRLLDMGFIADIRRIVADLPRARQSLLFSATMSRDIEELANSLLKDPVRVEVTPEVVTVDAIEQGVYPVKGDAKPELLRQLLTRQDVRKAIVFTRTKHGADRVARRLNAAGIEASAIHGNKTQGARRKALEGFKHGKEWVLVATDIAARGIDISGITHVINFELPHEPESYVHRIGRTARNGTTGVAWSLVEPAEGKQLGAIERLQRIDIPRLDAPEGLRARGTAKRRVRPAAVDAAAAPAAPAGPRPGHLGLGAVTVPAGPSRARAPRGKAVPKVAHKGNDAPLAKVARKGNDVPLARVARKGERRASGESRGHKGGAGRGGKPNGGRRFGAAPRAQRNRPSAA